MAMKAAHEPTVEDIMNLFACMVVLLAGCWVELRVLAGCGSGIVSFVLVVAERPAAKLAVS